MYEELVKRIRGCSYSDPNGCEECRDCPNAENYYECKQKLALQAADAIEELSMKLHGDEAAIAGMKHEIERMVRAEKPRWIPVTERLPDKSGNYLTAFGDGTAMAVNEFMHPRGWLTEEGREANPNGKWYWGDVTHWMPLPPAPEPQEEEA